MRVVGRYIRQLQKHCAARPRASSDLGDWGVLSESSSADSADLPKPSVQSADPSADFAVVFVSLLRKGTPDRDRSEAKLASAFDVVRGPWASVGRLFDGSQPMTCCGPSTVDEVDGLWGLRVYFIRKRR